MQILPAILAQSEHDFKTRILHRGLFTCVDVFHVDILDGSMFNAMCWADPHVIGQWKNLPNIELHIMAHNPLPVIDAWHAAVPSLVRVIFHVEVARPLGAIIERTKHMGFEVGLALNPETRLERIEHHLHDLDVLQIMGVTPGKSGQSFVGDAILTKIRRVRSLFPALTVSVDGGVNAQTIDDIVTAGAERLVCGAAIWSSANPEEAYKELMGMVQ